MGGKGGPAAVRRAYRRVWAAAVGAHLAVVLSFAIVSQAWTYALIPRSTPARTLFVVSTYGTSIFAGAAAYAFVRCRALVTFALRWLEEGRSATDLERRSLSLLPRRVAVLGAQVWAVVFPAGVWLFVAELDASVTPDIAIKGLASWSMLGFAATMLSYLLVERALRIERADALAGRALPAGDPGAMGMRTRLLLAWMGAAALPLVVGAIFFIGAPTDVRARGATVIWATTVVGLVAGLVLTLGFAGTIIGPIVAVRDRMRSVARGDLDVGIDVDDASELGSLQAGFNQMVDGLRERERMRDLFGRHVGAEVARHALESGFGLGGEACEATTMFVDMIGSTAMALRDTPDEVVASLNTFFETVVQVVADEGGYVNQFQGDGAVCVFGVPAQPERHAERGLRAARCLRERLAEQMIPAAIGVSSGEVVAGNVGAADRYGFTVIGDPANEAARLSDEAKLRDAHVLASGATIDLGGPAEATCWRGVGPISLRGRDRTTLAYEPV